MYSEGDLYLPYLFLWKKNEKANNSAKIMCKKCMKII